MRCPTAVALLALCGPAAAEPKLSGPETVEAGKLVRLEAKDLHPKAGLIWRVTPDRADRADAPRGRLQFAAPEGVYTVELLSVRLAPDGATEVGEARHVVTIGGGPKPPPVVDPGDPVTPPPGAALYLLVVRPDGPAAPAFTRVMSDPAWGKLRAAGHTVKDVTAQEAARLNVQPSTPLPAVVVLSVSADGKASSRVREAPLPATAADILKLPEGP